MMAIPFDWRSGKMVLRRSRTRHGSLNYKRLMFFIFYNMVRRPVAVKLSPEGKALSA